MQHNPETIYTVLDKITYRSPVGIDGRVKLLGVADYSKKGKG